MTMKMDVKHDREGHLKVNPSWFFQFGIALLVGIVGYFLDGSLQEIKSEMEFSRIERAQIRADLTAFQIGAAGDRFTQSQWIDERAQLEKELDKIRQRLTTLEAHK